MIFPRIFPEIDELNDPAVRDQVLNILKKNLKSHNPYERATAYNNLSIMYYIVGHYEKAKKWQEKAIELREKLVDDYAHLAKSYNTLSTIFYAMGKYVEALKQQKKAIFIFRKTLDMNHPVLIKFYNNLSSIYKALGEEKKAFLWKGKAEKLKKNLRSEKSSSKCNIITLCYILKRA